MIKPFLASYEITRKCNMKCLHCYNNSDYHGNETSLEKCLEVLDKLSSFGITDLVITGGEPLLKKDIDKISIYAREKFNQLTLQTNGSLITHVDEKILKCYDEVMIGVYGKENEDLRFKRYKKHYIKETLEKLRKLEIPFILTTVLMSVNKNRIDELYSFAKNEGAEGFLIQKLLPIGRARKHNWLSLSPIEESYIVRQLKKKYDRDEFVTICHLQRCGGGDEFIEINYKGNVSPCAFIPQKENIFEKPLEEIVYHSDEFKEFAKLKKGKKFCPIFIDD